MTTENKLKLKSGPRRASKSIPGTWYVCSGQEASPIATGSGTYSVSSGKPSTITVTIYDSADHKNSVDIAPNSDANLTVIESLFLVPKKSESGTAGGEFFMKD
jgi:hypothetical protein